MKGQNTVCLGDCSQSRTYPPAFKAYALAFVPFRLGAEELILKFVANCSTCDFPCY